MLLLIQEGGRGHGTPGSRHMEGQGALVHTANGNIWQSGRRADHIALGAAKASNVPVFIQTTQSNNFGEGIDGLLGLSFLGNFKFSLGKGILELQPFE